jgi:ribosomal protein L24E
MPKAKKKEEAEPKKRPEKRTTEAGRSYIVWDGDDTRCSFCRKNVDFGHGSILEYLEARVCWDCDSKVNADIEKLSDKRMAARAKEEVRKTEFPKAPIPPPPPAAAAPPPPAPPPAAAPAAPIIQQTLF